MRTCGLPALAAVLVLAACHSARVEYVIPVPPSPFANFAETFRVHDPDDSAWTMTLELRVTTDSVVSTLRGRYHDSLAQQIVATFDPQSLRLRTVTDSIPSRLETLRYGANRLQGMIIVQNLRGTRDTFHVDRQVDSFTIDRRSVLTTARWLLLEPGRTYAFPMFDPDAKAVYPLRIFVAGKMTIRGPTGPVEAYRLELTTDPPKWFAQVSYIFPTVLWVRADASRRLLRIERPRSNTVYELTVEWPSVP